MSCDTQSIVNFFLNYIAPALNNQMFSGAKTYRLGLWGPKWVKKINKNKNQGFLELSVYLYKYICFTHF